MYLYCGHSASEGRAVFTLKQSLGSHSLPCDYMKECRTLLYNSLTLTEQNL
jgi:hypothetical protein